MALSSTVYHFDIELSDVDRGVYETLALKVAKHPSEADDYMLTRLLAYCLEYCEGIAFAKGLEDASEPAVWAHDYAGHLLLWIEVGMPDAEKLHRASKAADRVTIYTHRDPVMLKRNLAGATIYRSEDIQLFAFDRAFMVWLISKLDRRMRLSLSRTEGHLYVSVVEDSCETALPTLGL
jgi:uncharacterized protein YaeQ